MPNITLPDGSLREFSSPVTVAEVAASIGAGLAKAALGGKVNGKLVDASFLIAEDASLAIVTAKDADGLEIIRHSTAHLLAYAVKELFPDAQVTIGPVIEHGFYYDFSYKRPFTPEDLVIIEKKMTELANKDETVVRRVLPRDEAVAFFKGLGEHYKAEIIASIPSNEDVSLYREGSFEDLCRGPHVPSTGKLKHFKLMKVAGAYWRGDHRNEMLQRVYGTAWASKDELQQYLTMLEEAEKRDHRKLGRELGLFTFHPWAPGAAFWLGKGTTLYNLLASYMREVLSPAGYLEVKTPLVYNKALWERSKHWSHYRDNMFLIESEGETMSVKPMNCPGHFLAFASQAWSYRDLPVRFHEQTPLHRNEASGVLSGLTRVRQFAQDDAHCFLTQDQIADEVERLINLVQRVYSDFDLPFTAKLSTRPDEFIGEIATWDHAEAQLKAALERAGMAYTINEKDGAFYGPKIDFDVTDAIGRKWQCATIQLDYAQPENFELKYIGPDNAEHRPVVIHRAIFGSFERFIAVLIEHYAGAFPLWLAPVQAVVLPISDRHLPYARSVLDALTAAGLRAELDERQEKIGYKVREAQLQKIPYMLVVGDRESEQGAVSVRTRAGGDQGSRSLQQFIADAIDEVKRRGRVASAAA
jgi:threonyl-tRNA synthetase